MGHAPIERLVDGDGGGGEGIERGGAQGTTAWAEGGTRHGQMSVVRVNHRIGYCCSGGGEGEEEDSICVGVVGGDGVLAMNTTDPSVRIGRA
jgi:hypothetical protein